MIKRFTCILAAILMLLVCATSFAEVRYFENALRTTVARTTVLDLTNTTSTTISERQGWFFYPDGDNGNPKLVLDCYGLESAHSAPIKLPPNTLIEVNGDCYIDNSYMQAKHDVIYCECNGYLHIDGTGTLNLYSETYAGSSIRKQSGAASNHNDDLVIENVTVNCYNRECNSYTAFENEACIYAYKSITIRNAVINTYSGKYGIWAWGETPIGGVSEETADEILIEDSTINIQNVGPNVINQYAEGIDITWGRIRITGDSNITINAGSRSIYSYLSFVIEGGSVDVRSTPVASSTDSWALVQCNCLKIGPDAEYVHFTTTRWPLTVVLYCKENYLSSLGDGLNVTVGSFGSEGYTTDLDPETGFPALTVVSESGGRLLGDVDLNGLVEFADVTLLSAYLLNELTLSEQSLINANANEDESVNVLDLSAIYEIILNKSNSGK